MCLVYRSSKTDRQVSKSPMFKSTSKNFCCWSGSSISGVAGVSAWRSECVGFYLIHTVDFSWRQ